MLAPHRLFDAIFKAVESRSSESINQLLLDDLNEQVKKMCHSYVKIYGYAKPDFTIEFLPEYENSVVVTPNNKAAVKIVNSYYDTLEEQEDGS